LNWGEVFAALIVSHLAGDFLLQTDWQARNKGGGLGRDPLSRRALRDHIATYTLCFLPALVWIGVETNAVRAVLIGLLIAAQHWIQDDGRLLDAYMSRIKGSADPAPGLRIAVDQSFHLLFLFAASLLAAA